MSKQTIKEFKAKYEGLTDEQYGRAANAVVNAIVRQASSMSRTLIAAHSTELLTGQELDFAFDMVRLPDFAVLVKETLTNA